jgi:ribosomal protein S18 acetylase RimI-like enzyme
VNDLENNLEVRSSLGNEADECEAILRSLPDWFGIEASIVQYRKDLDRMQTEVAVIDGRIAGFITIHHRFPETAEIHLIAVRREHHRAGIGRTLVEHAQRLLTSQGVEYLEVKTQGPSRPNLYYDRTRSFYQAMGFRPLEENNLWGEKNPCLILVKHLACKTSE